MNDLPGLLAYEPSPGGGVPDGPFTVRRPAVQTVPVVFVSAHSGTRYSHAFRAMTRLDPLSLRRSEDTFVDTLFAAAPGQGAPLLSATFPRAYCDVNRDTWELDPAMFDGALPGFVDTRSPRAAAGFGTIPRLVGAGLPIYAGRLAFAEAQRRVAECWEPFHAALRALVAETRDRFGGCIVLDCHSMPRSAGPGGRLGAAYVLGDAHGRSAGPSIVARMDAALRATGQVVSRNDPYAGGFITRHYGRPAHRVHALQIEIARDLYMDERTLQPHQGFDAIRREIEALITRVIETLSDAL